VALLTGRNPHSANMGSVAEVATAFPGQTAERPNSVATIAEILKLNGYSTAMFGKTHEFTPWELGPSGPFESWPTGSGFERFYGTLSGEADLFAPTLMDNSTLVDLPNDPNYLYQTDLAAHAISWIRSQKTMTPDKPFFVYYAAPGTHAPSQVPAGKLARGGESVPTQTARVLPGTQYPTSPNLASGAGDPDIAQPLVQSAQGH